MTGNGRKFREHFNPERRNNAGRRPGEMRPQGHTPPRQADAGIDRSELPLGRFGDAKDKLIKGTDLSVIGICRLTTAKQQQNGYQPPNQGRSAQINPSHCFF